MENENQNSTGTNQPTSTPPVVPTPVPTPTPIPEQPKIEKPIVETSKVEPVVQPVAEKPKVEPIRIGQQPPVPPVAPPVVAPSVVAPAVAPAPEGEDKAKTEEEWLNKTKPVTSKVEELKKDLAVESVVATKFKTALERLKAKRVEFKKEFPIIYWWVFAGVLVASISLGLWLIYYVIFYEDYLVTNEVRCNPYKEKCFIWQCDPEELGEDKCTGNPKEDTIYYKYEQRMNSKVPYCDPAKPDCLPFECEEGEENCGEVLCTEDNEDGVDCIDPTSFALDNPAPIGEECEGGDCEEDSSVDDFTEDEIIADEGDSAEDLEAEAAALQEAENNIKNGN